MDIVRSTFDALDAPDRLHPAMKTPDVRTVVGQAMEPYLDDLARLRMTVFREWPYLYAGDYRYEFDYLQTYLRSPFSLAVLVLDGGQVVGASTGLPLVHEAAELVAPFAQSSVSPEEVFYLGESVLLPAYRGRGLGHRFFEEREAHARALGATPGPASPRSCATTPTRGARRSIAATTSSGASAATSPVPG